MAHPRDRAPLVRNADDPAQVNFARRVERDRVIQLRKDVQAVLALEEGRRFLWELLERAGVYRSIWSKDAAIHYNAGRQDFGHELMALLVDTDEDLYQLMEREARQRARYTERGAAAVQTASAQGGNDGR